MWRISNSYFEIAIIRAANDVGFPLWYRQAILDQAFIKAKGHWIWHQNRLACTPSTQVQYSVLQKNLQSDKQIVHMLVPYWSLNWATNWTNLHTMWRISNFYLKIATTKIANGVGFYIVELLWLDNLISHQNILVCTQGLAFYHWMVALKEGNFVNIWFPVLLCFSVKTQDNIFWFSGCLQRILII